MNVINFEIKNIVTLTCRNVKDKDIELLQIYEMQIVW